MRREVEDWLDGSASAALSRPVVGSLLVAMPSLGDPTFEWSVVLLTSEHEGYQGVILSEPTDDDVQHALPRWWRASRPPRVLHRGGPCEPDLLMCLAVGRPGLAIAGLTVVRAYGDQTLYRIDGEVDEDEFFSRVSGLRLFRGYSGWDPGQLEYEISLGAWLVVDSQPDDAVSDAPSTLWRDVLERQDGAAAFLRACPENPLHN